MATPDSINPLLLRAALSGDAQAFAAIFSVLRPRLRRMVRLRIDPRISGRLDESDVLQEAYLDIQKRLGEYADNPTMPIYLWMRFLTNQRLLILHRRHLLTAMRGTNREISLNGWAGPAASSVSLARHLLGRSGGISKAAMRTELQAKLEEALNQLDDVDREVLVLRHFEELSNSEAAEVLGLRRTAASQRYVRAIKRLRTVIENVPGLMPESR